MNEAPMFAIVVPTYNVERNIERLLRSIGSQIDCTHSVVLVDQSSTDRTAEIARTFGATVIEIPKPIFYTPPGRARNVGAQSIEGRILLHLDADMELGSNNFLRTLANLIDADHRAAVIHEVDVASGFWAKCKALERSCYRGTQMQAARAVSRDLFTQVGGYDEEVSSGEDFYAMRLYEKETQVATNDSLVILHHVGNSSLGSMLSKKLSYGRTAKTYLAKARTVGASSGPSIIRNSVLAYLNNWRLLGKQPAHYLCIFPLRAMELVAVQLGMWLGPRSGGESGQVHREPPTRA